MSDTYDLYVDDSGSRLPDKRTDPAEDRKDRMNAFALGGFLVKSEEASYVYDMHARLIEDFGIEGVLHSHKIRGCQGEFRWLKNHPERASEFYHRVTHMLTRSPLLATACVVHRPGYRGRYDPLYGSQRWLLCKSAYTILVERAAKYARRHGRRLRVYVEASGKKEDQAIKEYHRALLDQGMLFDAGRSSIYSPLQQQDFASALFKNPKFIKKDNPYAQVADLLLYPLVKSGYDPHYRPYVDLYQAGNLIDVCVGSPDREGVKYYCFD